MPLEAARSLQGGVEGHAHMAWSWVTRRRGTQASLSHCLKRQEGTCQKSDKMPEVRTA